MMSTGDPQEVWAPAQPERAHSGCMFAYDSLSEMNPVLVFVAAMIQMGMFPVLHLHRL